MKDGMDARRKNWVGPLHSELCYTRMIGMPLVSIQTEDEHHRPRSP